MDRQPQDYAAAAAAMAYAQGQQPPPPQYGGYHPQAPLPQYPPHPYGAPLPQYPPGPYARPMPPAYSHLPPHQQPPPPYAAHPPPPHVLSTPSPPPHHPYMHPPPFESAPPPPAAPPADPELQKRIDKLVEYIAKNGPDFEAMIRDKQHDNPDYAFVFGGEGHAYYRYMLWLLPRPPVPAPYPSGSMHMMPPMGPMMRGPPIHQPGYPPFYDQHQQFAAHGHGDYEAAAQPFKGLSGALPADVAAELQDVLNNLNGTKESIKGAKSWFMQRLPFTPALAEALKERVFVLEDSERQLHIIFLVNDILFESLQRRTNIRDLDNEAIAFKSVLGSMLARVYNNSQSKDDNQTRIEKILQFWGSKEVYDQETIANFEREMKGGLPYPLVPRHVSPDPSTFSGSAPLRSKWSSEPPEKDNAIHPVAGATQSVPSAQFPANQLPAGVYPPVGQTTFAASLPVQPSLIPSVAPQSTAPTNDSNPPPYPLFPPGLIPGMVRKMQIGSGVPYSPLSPLDIPTTIPPSTVPESEILERVSKFFSDIGEVNPSEGPMRQSEPGDYDDYERELPARKGGACIPPPPNLLVTNPETGMRADGSIDSKPGSSGRLGLGASADPNEVSQYDDVYSSYRKQRSTTYHSSITARSSTAR